MKNENLIKHRRQLNKTIRQLARDSNLSVDTYRTYEYGIRTPSIFTAIKIGDALGVTDLREIWAINNKPVSV